MFKTGEKIVCINIDNQKFGGLVLNEIYEVLRLCYHPKSGIADGVYVKGFSYPHIITRFRKLDTDFAEDCLKNISKQVAEQFMSEFQPS